MNNRIFVDGYRSFLNPNIQSLRAIRDVALNGRSLDVDTLTATVADNVGALGAHIGAKIIIQRGGTRVGVYYLTSVSQIAAEIYTMQMTSPLGRLEQIGHVGGVYSGKNAEDLITEICGGVSVTVEAPFDTATVTGWLPYVSPADESGAQTGTAKDNLMQVIFALNASLWADEDGVLHVGNLDRRTVRTFDADSIFLDGYEIEHTKPASQIVLTEHSFVAASGDASVLFDGSASAGQRVIFSEPMHSLTPTGTLTITESGANYAVLGAGTGTLTGVPYLHITRELTETVTVGAATNKVTISDATLVGTLNSAAVMERLKAYYAITQTMKADVLLEWERPGNVISILDRFSNSMISATIAAISPINFSQTLRGSIEALIGFLPWNEGSYEQQKVVLTGSGSFVVPAGVTTLTVVLIGGGGGGAAGADGEDAKPSSDSSQREDYGNTMVYTLGSVPQKPSYGAGGTGGTGGEGGKILKVTLSVSNGDVFAFSCGAGGTGGLVDGTPAAVGGITEFGAFSTSEGVADPYYDPYDQASYGGTGEAGTDGGRGGGFESDGTVIPPPQVVYRGVTYNPGADGESASGSAGVYYREYGNFTANSRGGFGGGAAAGADGEDGADGICAARWYEAVSTSVAGGNGADAIAQSAQAVYGRGGKGGNGGGGGGSNGGARSRNTVAVPAVHEDGRLYVNAYAPAHGGAGSAGGKGGDGCVIVYYRTLNS